MRLGPFEIHTRKGVMVHVAQTGQRERVRPFRQRELGDGGGRERERQRQRQRQRETDRDRQTDRQTVKPSRGETIWHIL